MLADVVEEVGVVLWLDVVGDDTGVGDVHALTDVLVWRWWERGSGLPVGVVHGAGEVLWSVGVGGVSGGGWGDLVDLGLVVVEVGQGGDLGAVDGHETVLVGLLEVHVHDTAGPDIGHVWAVEGLDLGELSGGDPVTAVLGEEDRDGQVSEVLGTLGVAGLVEGGLTAPLVHVDTEEVGLDVLAAAGEVVSERDTGLGVVVGGVADGDVSVALLLDVLLGVTQGGLDKGRGVGVGVVVGNLVTGEETEDVSEVGKGVDDLLVAVVQLDGPGWVDSVDGGVWRGQVSQDVDAGVVERLHALGVVRGGIDSIDTDDVGVQLLEVWDISGTGLVVGERVVNKGTRCSISGHVRGVLLVGNTPDVELGAIAGVEELVAHDLDCWQVDGLSNHGGGGDCEQRSNRIQSIVT